MNIRGGETSTQFGDMSSTTSTANLKLSLMRARLAMYFPIFGRHPYRRTRNTPLVRFRLK